MLPIPDEGEDATEGDLRGTIGENEHEQPRQQQPPQAFENLATRGTSDGIKTFPCDKVTGCVTTRGQREEQGREPRPC